MSNSLTTTATTTRNKMERQSSIRNIKRSSSSNRIQGRPPPTDGPAPSSTSKKNLNNVPESPTRVKMIRSSSNSSIVDIADLEFVVTACLPSRKVVGVLVSPIEEESFSPRRSKIKRSSSSNSIKKRTQEGQTTTATTITATKGMACKGDMESPPCRKSKVKRSTSSDSIGIPDLTVSSSPSKRFGNNTESSNLKRSSSSSSIGGCYGGILDIQSISPYAPLLPCRKSTIVPEAAASPSRKIKRSTSRAKIEPPSSPSRKSSRSGGNGKNNNNDDIATPPPMLALTRSSSRKNMKNTNNSTGSNNSKTNNSSSPDRKAASRNSRTKAGGGGGPSLAKISSSRALDTALLEECSTTSSRKEAQQQPWLDHSENTLSSSGLDFHEEDDDFFLEFEDNYDISSNDDLWSPSVKQSKAPARKTNRTLATATSRTTTTTRPRLDSRPSRQTETNAFQVTYSGGARNVSSRQLITKSLLRKGDSVKSICVKGVSKLKEVDNLSQSSTNQSAGSLGNSMEDPDEYHRSPGVARSPVSRSRLKKGSSTDRPSDPRRQKSSHELTRSKSYRADVPKTAAPTEGFQCADSPHPLLALSSSPDRSRSKRSVRSSRPSAATAAGGPAAPVDKPTQRANQKLSQRLQPPPPPFL